MTMARIRAVALDRIVSENNGLDSDGALLAPGLMLLRHQRCTSLDTTLYDAVFCLIIQGEKETMVAESTERFGEGRCLLLSHDMPVSWRITRSPYLSLVIRLDLALLRSLYDEVGEGVPDSTEARPLQVHFADEALLDVTLRYLTLDPRSTDARVLGPMILRELHYRLLMAPFGGMLRRLIRFDSHESAIARAIAQLRRDFRDPIAIPALARAVGMSTSSFHKHFKAITASSPLQYQKELRLLEARRLLLTSPDSVTEIAFQVGYESPTQFSREYARRFGLPPSKEQPEAAQGAAE